MAKQRTHTYTIRETHKGWLVLKCGKLFPRAVKALHWVKKDAKVDTSSKAADLVAWEPQTSAGRQIVKILTEALRGE